MEERWHGKLRGRQVLWDPGWTCVLFVKTGGASQDIFIRVMFDTIREQSVVLHSVAVKLGLRASGGPMWLTHLHVRGTCPGLEGAKGLDQSPRCELRDTVGAA